MAVQQISIDAVSVGLSRRPCGDVAQLADSIAQLGLLNPITVTSDLLLVAGLHRLRACQRLGWTEIPATVLDMSDVERRLAEIDENLIRNELTALERSEQLERRKRLYEAMHPETKHGAAPGKAGGGKVAKVAESASFDRDTAAKTGISPRVIREQVQIATSIPTDVREQLKSLPVPDQGKPLADRKTELLKLAQHAPDKQREIVTRISTGDLERVPQRQRDGSVVISMGDPVPFTKFEEALKTIAGWKHDRAETERQCRHWKTNLMPLVQAAYEVMEGLCGSNRSEKAAS